MNAFSHFTEMAKARVFITEMPKPRVLISWRDADSYLPQQPIRVLSIDGVIRKGRLKPQFLKNRRF